MLASSEASLRMRLIVGFLEENWPAVDIVAVDRDGGVFKVRGLG